MDHRSFRAEFRNASGVEVQTQSIVLGFRAVDGDTLQLVISAASARQLRDSLTATLPPSP